MKADMKERAELVKAMETIARCINNESVFESWLMYGVADGDITGDEDDDIEYYCEDENLKELIDLFMRLMVRARKSGGLYIDGICAGEKNE